MIGNFSLFVWIVGYVISLLYGYEFYGDTANWQLDFIFLLKTGRLNFNVID